MTYGNAATASVQFIQQHLCNASSDTYVHPYYLSGAVYPSPDPPNSADSGTFLDAMSTLAYRTGDPTLKQQYVKIIMITNLFITPSQLDIYLRSDQLAINLMERAPWIDPNGIVHESKMQKYGISTLGC